MKIDYKKIINIKNKNQLNKFPLNKPIYHNNYLFHYLVMLNNIDGFKLKRFPVYIENHDKLNAFHLAAKENNIKILYYLIKNYPEYIYNSNYFEEKFTAYLLFEEFPNLIKKFPNLDWYELIINGAKNNLILKSILTNSNYSNLKKFLNLYKLELNKDQYLFEICNNQKLSVDEKIEILDKFSDEDINQKTKMGDGLILYAIDLNNEKLFDYLLNRNIDIDYYTGGENHNPLEEAVLTDIINNKKYFSKKILDKLININPTFYKSTNKYLNNITHHILFVRMNRNAQINLLDNIDYSIDLDILKQCDSETWNKLNIDKVTPLELISNLDFNIYSKLFNNISINPNIIDKIKNKNWKELFQKLNIYTEKNDVIIDDQKYTHYTLFQARFKDVAIFSLYLNDTYKDLYIPNMTTYKINNITFDDGIPFSDEIISKEPIFPWLVMYNFYDNEYYIHPYLNNLINSERRSNKKRYVLVFLELRFRDNLHANILFYDLKNMTIERFEPYGGNNIDNRIDDTLEEELTWNTGLKYIRPKDYLPYSGFQMISDENNLKNQKPGDFGGFCLAWCLWYVETRLKNQDIDSKILNEKLINKINSKNIKFSEYIRNYSNKINDKRIQYLKKMGIDNNKVSDLYPDNDTDFIITKYIINRYNNIN